MEKTIDILGYNGVRMRYCAATETGFERLTGKPISIFLPKTQNVNGEVTTTAPEAATIDYLTLAMAGIIAAYARTNEEAPIEMDALLYEARPEDIVLLITTICELRNDWYKIPAVIQADQQTEESPKNA
jgi:hypothetical protein